MSRLIAQKRPEILDWDAIYRQGTPSWETGAPAGELVRVVEKGIVRPGTVLELGCGTGADAVYLARRGFEVTAVDISPMAVERARVRAEREDALLRFVLADVLEFGPTAGQFDLVYDAGFYRFIRQHALEKFLDMLWRVTRPGSLYLSLADAAGETADWAPPEISEEDIKTVSEQTGADEETAKKTIEKNKGDLAAAIMELKKE